MQENPHFKNILYPYTMYIYIENNQDLNEKMSESWALPTKKYKMYPNSSANGEMLYVCHFTVGLSVLVGLVHSNTGFCINIKFDKAELQN